MTPDRLRELIAAGETLDVEFKSDSVNPVYDRELIEAIICLANRSSSDFGYLIVGVDDDGTISGARPRHEGTTDIARLQALIANRTRPSISVRTESVSVGGVAVLVIEIPPSRYPVGSTDGKYVRRAIGGDGRPACVPFAFHEMQAQQADRGLLDYTQLRVQGATWDDLDALEFERFRRLVRESRGRSDESLVALSDLDLAKALGAVEANHTVTSIRILGLLLFGREGALCRYLPTHEIAFQALRGNEVEVNEFFRWPLLRSMDEIEARFRSRNRESETQVGLLRIGIPDYSPKAFREAVANAIVHRNYSERGAIHIQWHTDRIEISSPGGFPEGVRLTNLLVTPPRPRNPLLADAFKRAGFVERTARGIDTIFFEQLRNGRPAPSYERSTDVSVVVVLPGGEANVEFVRFVTEEGQSGRQLSLDDLLVLNELWIERRATATDIAAVMQKPEAEARARLHSLVERGLVEARGGGRARTYHLSSAAYRRLGRKSEYVRQRGFEPLQQEAMVMQYARTHGRITRSDAAALCQISSEEAKNILRRLAREGRLRLHGERRTAYYTPQSLDVGQNKHESLQKHRPKTKTNPNRG